MDRVVGSRWTRGAGIAVGQVQVISRTTDCKTEQHFTHTLHDTGKYTHARILMNTHMVSHTHMHTHTHTHTHTQIMLQTSTAVHDVVTSGADGARPALDVAGCAGCRRARRVQVRVHGAGRARGSGQEVPSSAH